MFYLQLLLIVVLFGVCSLLSLPGIFWDRFNLNFIYGRIFSALAQRVCGIRVVVEGMVHTRTGRSAIYVANHQSGMDVMLFGGMFPRRGVIIGKREILLLPIFNLFFVLGGNILIDRTRRVNAISGLNKALERMKRRNLSIWIFPEGTRNRDSGPLLPFKKGAFYMAVQAQVPVIPVIASPLAPLMSWKKRKIGPGTVVVRVLPPVETRGLADQDVDALLEKVRNSMSAAFTELGSRVPR